MYMCAYKSECEAVNGENERTITIPRVELLQSEKGNEQTRKRQASLDCSELGKRRERESETESANERVTAISAGNLAISPLVSCNGQMWDKLFNRV